MLNTILLSKILPFLRQQIPAVLLVLAVTVVLCPAQASGAADCDNCKFLQEAMYSVDFPENSREYLPVSENFSLPAVSVQNIWRHGEFAKDQTHGTIHKYNGTSPSNFQYRQTPFFHLIFNKNSISNRAGPADGQKGIFSEVI